MFIYLLKKLREMVYQIFVNKYLKNYDSNKESTFIMYWDANNL